MRQADLTCFGPGLSAILDCLLRRACFGGITFAIRRAVTGSGGIRTDRIACVPVTIRMYLTMGEPVHMTTFGNQ